MIKQTACTNLTTEVEHTTDSNVAPENTEELEAVQGEFGVKYNLINSLGSGAYGFVRKASHKENKKEVCTNLQHCTSV